MNDKKYTTVSFVSSRGWENCFLNQTMRKFIDVIFELILITHKNYFWIFVFQKYLSKKILCIFDNEMANSLKNKIQYAFFFLSRHLNAETWTLPSYNILTLKPSILKLRGGVRCPHLDFAKEKSTYCRDIKPDYNFRPIFAHRNFYGIFLFKNLAWLSNIWKPYATIYWRTKSICF